MFVKIEQGVVAQYPYTLAQMLDDNKGTSFPSVISAELREFFGVFDVDYQGAPEFDPLTHRVEHSAAPLLIDGKWTLTATVVEKTQEQIAAANAGRAAQARAERNTKLSATDWRFRSDMTPSQQWIDYCQALRDVPSQAGFPWSIQWPTQPE
jgi:hypothetical protein